MNSPGTLFVLLATLKCSSVHGTAKKGLMVRLKRMRAAAVRRETKDQKRENGAQSRTDRNPKIVLTGVNSGNGIDSSEASF